MESNSPPGRAPKKENWGAITLLVVIPIGLVVMVVIGVTSITPARGAPTVTSKQAAAVIRPPAPPPASAALPDALPDASPGE